MHVSVNHGEALQLQRRQLKPKFVKSNQMSHKIKLGYRNWGNFAQGGNWTFSLIINQKSAGQNFSGNCLFQVS